MEQKEQKKNMLALWIFIGLIAGVIAGTIINLMADTTFIAQYVAIAKYGSIIFLKFIKLIIGPLVLSTLVVGVAGIGDAGTVGRMGVKTIGWFIFASLMSLTLGLIIVNLFQPGLDFQNQISDAVASNLPKTDSFTLDHFIEQLIPENIFVALSSHKMVLQIVVFSVLFGLATAAIVIAEKGLGIMVQYGKLIMLFYFSLLLLWAILLTLGYLFVGKRVWTLLSHIKEPIVLAFATASSESAYPKLLNQLERFGVNEKITSFVLPLGYSFNLDGSMMYMTFGSLLIAQAYGVDLTISQQITMLLVLMVTSKGIAAVPRASLVVIAATIAGFGIPEIGLAILLPVDQFLDMGRTATNVVGNAVATVAVSRMEGEDIHT